MDFQPEKRNAVRQATRTTAAMVKDAIEQQRAAIAVELLGELENKLQDPALASAVVETVTTKAVTQDPLLTSKRVWSAALSVGTSALLYVLLDPATQTAALAWIKAHAGTYAPILLPAAGALLAWLSKYADPRPTRGQDANDATPH